MATRDQIAQLLVHRQIAQIAGGRRARKPRAKIPEIREPRGLRTAYLVTLRGMLAELQRLTSEIVIAGLPRLVQLGPPELRLDAPADEQFSQDMGRLRGEAEPIFGEAAAVAAATTVAQSVSTSHRTEFGRQMVAAIGIDPFIADVNLASQIDGFVADNVSLVKSLGEEQLGRLEGIVKRGLRAGTRAETIANEVREAFDISRRRAVMIATDQVNKLNGQLTRSRQQQVGITKYRWSTSRDERVRPGHRALEGTIQEWNKPPITNPKTGGRAHPHENPRCRCEAIPVVDDLLKDLGIDVPAPTPRLQRPFPAAAPRRRAPRPAAEPRGRTPAEGRAPAAPPPKPAPKPSTRTRGGSTKLLTPRQQSAEQNASWLRPSRNAREAASFDERADWYQWEWVHGSNRKTSVLMKQAALREFGGSGTVFSRGVKFRFEQRDVSMVRRDLRSIYTETQRDFRAAGTKTIRLYRGYHGDPPARGALESWTSDPAVARKFAAKGRDGQVLVEDVPVSRILNHHRGKRWVDGIWGKQDEYMVMW